MSCYWYDTIIPNFVTTGFQHPRPPPSPGFASTPGIDTYNSVKCRTLVLYFITAFLSYFEILLDLHGNNTLTKPQNCLLLHTSCQLYHKG